MEVMPRRRRGEREQGFTLLEIVICLGILTFGLLGVAAMQLHALRGGAQGRHTTQAMTIAQDQMEDFQRANFAGMTQTAGWVAPQTVKQQIDSNSGTQTEQTYDLSWRITDEVANWTKTVDVRVTWSEPNRPSRQVVISSRRYNW